MLKKRRQSIGKHADQQVNDHKETSKVSTLVGVMRIFAEQTNTLGIEGLRNNFCKLQARGPHPSKLTFNAHKINRTKCRYNDIMCLDNSRVFLKPWPEGQGDFIHANWITNELLEYPFICTQGPLNQTCGDFWRMVWQENVELIIMLCRTCEENRNKCAQYWPLNQGQVLTFCGITIRAVEKRTGDPDVHCTALLLTYRGKRRPLSHYQWVSWPDKFVPNQLTVPFTLLSSARARKTPTVVHCSAGIGRTGTLVVLEILSRTLLSCRIPVVSDIIWSVRSQRSRAVQNEEQYLYIHYLTIQRLVNKGIVPDRIVSKFCRDYEHFYFTRTHRTQIPLPIYDRKKKLRSKKVIGTESVTPLSSLSTSPSTIMPTSTTSDVRLPQQQKKRKGPRKKKTQMIDATDLEKRMSVGNVLTSPTQQSSPAIATRAKLSRSQLNLQREYHEAQNALLESYRKAQMDLMKTFSLKQRGKDKLTPVETNVVQNAQKENQELNVEIADTSAIKVAEGSKVAEREAVTKSEGDEPGSKSVYAFLSDEVRKIKQMQENLIPKEDEIDRADYVFMQPVYARTYGALDPENRDVAEKYVMNMLPEQYFDRTVDDGAEYVIGTPQIRIKENSESVEKLQKSSPKPM
ncbi:Tyrosine-protein phosphatase non-receptor type [Dirofilaria immitis]